jgi:SAM-dependent methyltransferase
VGPGTADVVISNCVLNLVPDKKTVFEEIRRVLKQGGHFSISDVVIEGALPEKIKTAAEMYAGCIAGAVQKEDYLNLIREAGFNTITIQKEKAIVIPDEILRDYLNDDEIKAHKASETGILSITVFAKKDNCCTPGSGCC